MLSAAEDGERAALPTDLEELADVVRRVVRARLGSVDEVDDLVQETLARVLGARARLDADALAPYAIVTARNLVASHWRRSATNRRNVHRLFDPAQPARA